MKIFMIAFFRWDSYAVEDSLMNADRWLVAIAICVSLFGLFYSMYFNRKTLRLTQEHNKKMVTPALVFERDFNVTTKFTFFCSIKNAGFGPAIITSVKFIYKDKTFNDLHNLFMSNIQFYYGRIDDKETKLSKLDENEVLASGGNQELYFAKGKNVAIVVLMKDILSKTVITVNYECVYGSKHILKEFVNSF